LAVSQALELPLPQLEVAARLAEGVRLVGADLPGRRLSGWETGGLDRGGAAPGTGEVGPERNEGALAGAGLLAAGTVEPGGHLGLVLVWTSAEVPAANYSVFVHLVDRAGNTVAQSDSWPACGQAPTSAWRPGEYVFDPHVLTLPADLTGGEYLLRVGMYDAATGRRLAVERVGKLATGGDAVALARFQVDGR
jgi:hypothetical protein